MSTARTAMCAFVVAAARGRGCGARARSPLQGRPGLAVGGAAQRARAAASPARLLPRRPSPIWQASRSRSATAGRPTGACRATPAYRRISTGRAPPTWRAVRCSTRRPSRMSEPAAETVGYKHAVLFPVEVVPKDPSQPVALALALEFGVCREICIPAEAKFSLTLPPAGMSGQAVAGHAGRARQGAAAAGAAARRRIRS